MINVETFFATYSKHLTQCVKDFPDQYAYPAEEVPATLDRMTGMLNCWHYAKWAKSIEGA